MPPFLTGTRDWTTIWWTPQRPFCGAHCFSATETVKSRMGHSRALELFWELQSSETTEPVSFSSCFLYIIRYPIDELYKLYEYDSTYLHVNISLCHSQSKSKYRHRFESTNLWVIFSIFIRFPYLFSSI